MVSQPNRKVDGLEVIYGRLYRYDERRGRTLRISRVWEGYCPTCDTYSYHLWTAVGGYGTLIRCSGRGRHGSGCPRRGSYLITVAAVSDQIVTRESLGRSAVAL